MNTLAVTVNETGFEYDIHSLIKAFYPAADVKVISSDEKETSDEGLPNISISFGSKSIIMSVSRDEVTVTNKADTDSDDRKHTKNVLKKLIYETLNQHTGVSLPWGTLTGIRPTKIPMAMMNDGIEGDEIEDYLKTVYCLSDSKAKLCMDIAATERKILSNIDYENGYSVYIGIPFCPTTCLYCSFTSYPIVSWKKRIDEYLSCLEKEIDFTADIYRDKVLNTIYIGGGTPTTLESDELDRLLNKITHAFNMKSVREFTVEAGRADSITEEKLMVLKKYNVTRISVNPQTMNQDTLDFIGRRHTVDDVVEAFLLARRLGFDNINMDIILGLPKETAKEVTHTIQMIKELSPDSLTVHSLAVKRASKLAEWIQKNGIEELMNTDETMKIAFEGAYDMKMKPYYLYRQKNMSGNFENVGFSKEGKFGIYNILIMEEVQTIIALGAGSVTKRVYSDGRIERCDNVKDVGLYIEKIDEMIERKRQLLK